jgi:hypothetical protein
LAFPLDFDLFLLGARFALAGLDAAVVRFEGASRGAERDAARFRDRIYFLVYPAFDFLRNL